MTEWIFYVLPYLLNVKCSKLLLTFFIKNWQVFVEVFYALVTLSFRRIETNVLVLLCPKKSEVFQRYVEDEMLKMILWRECGAIYQMFQCHCLWKTITMSHEIIVHSILFVKFLRSVFKAWLTISVFVSFSILPQLICL